MMRQRSDLALWLVAGLSVLAFAAHAALRVTQAFAPLAFAADAGARVQPARFDAPRVDLAPIFDFAPFGDAAASPAAVVPDFAEAAPLGYGLAGVLLDPEAGRSRALLVLETGEAIAVAAGDALPDGAVVEQIEAQRLRVLRGDKTAYVGFPDPAASQDITASGALFAPQTAAEFMTVPDTGSEEGSSD